MYLYYKIQWITMFSEMTTFFGDNHMETMKTLLARCRILNVKASGNKATTVL